MYTYIYIYFITQWLNIIYEIYYTYHLINKRREIRYTYQLCSVNDAFIPIPVCECSPCYSGHYCEALCGGSGTCNNSICECHFSGGRGELCTEHGCPGIKGHDCSGRGQCLVSLTEVRSFIFVHSSLIRNIVIINFKYPVSFFNLTI